MNKENCALKLVDEIILYYDARSKKHQITALVRMLMGKPKEIGHLCNTNFDGTIKLKSSEESVWLCEQNESGAEQDPVWLLWLTQRNGSDWPIIRPLGNPWWYLRHYLEEAVSYQPTDGFGGLVVSILATGNRVRGFKLGRSRWIFRASGKSSVCLSSDVPALRHVKEPSEFC